MAKRQYSEDVKAAVMAALLTGQSVSAVARQYEMPRGTVSAWATRMDRPRPVADADTKKEIGELILLYLRELLGTLRIQARIFADAKWLEKQSASEVAVLHGVLADKGIRLLEALADSEQAET